ncbi:hypothetical protein BDZ94DRAFT_1311718 [Collybia nuda]|uniref:F-box domain-containing protein n=1 Tax=Collybia nuda TaxID=64659 RepID=A0A9P5Y0L2_9AGAR|nr:hypothetical protein BDZ94DRAFT_1311718 [Collybia nuda]
MNTHIDPLRLPPELLGYIINELRHNQQALINTSLASRSFLPFCRPHLFRALKIPPARKPMEAFENTEAGNQNHDMRRLAESHIAFHVRDLHIEISRIRNTDLDPTDLTSFLQNMTQIQSLSISAARSS